MGIPGLLPFLSSVVKKKNLSQFSGIRVAIDGFVWLHAAAYSCSKELYSNPKTKRILPYCMKRISNMRNVGITPIIIFDGQYLNAKANVNMSRSAHRQAAIETVTSNPDSPDSVYMQAVSITFDTVQTLIQALRSENIEYIVAPYEADAQLAYLAQIGYVDAVCTIDSDLIPYLTPLIFYKLDDQNNVDVIELKDVLSSLKLTPHLLQIMCILAGCDYTPKVGQLGINTAFSLVKNHGLNALIEAHKNPRLVFPPNYDTFFSNALLLFNHQTVYDPNAQCITSLHYIENPPSFLGTFIPTEFIIPFVTGQVDPNHYLQNTNSQNQNINSQDQNINSQNQNINSQNQNIHLQNQNVFSQNIPYIFEMNNSNNETNQGSIYLNLKFFKKD